MEAGARRFAFGRTVDEDVLVLDRQVFKGELEVDLVTVSGEMDELEQVLRGRAGTEAAIEQRLGPVGDDLWQGRSRRASRGRDTRGRRRRWS